MGDTVSLGEWRMADLAMAMADRQEFSGSCNRSTASSRVVLGEESYALCRE